MRNLWYGNKTGEWFISPRLLYRKVTAFPTWYCKSVALFHISEKHYLFYFHWHIGKKEGFRIRTSEFLGIFFRIPFLKYSIA